MRGAPISYWRSILINKTLWQLPHIQFRLSVTHKICYYMLFHFESKCWLWYKKQNPDHFERVFFFFFFKSNWRTTCTECLNQVPKIPSLKRPWFTCAVVSIYMFLNDSANEVNQMFAGFCFSCVWNKKNVLWEIFDRHFIAKKLNISYKFCSISLPLIECHCENEMRPKDAIRCRECGYRIMYKKRTKRCKSIPKK